MSLNEVISRLFLPLSVGIVLIGGFGAYLLLRSSQLDKLNARSQRERELIAAARAALRQSRKILLRTAVRAVLLVLLLLSAIVLLNRL